MERGALCKLAALLCFQGCRCNALDGALHGPGARPSLARAEGSCRGCPGLRGWQPHSLALLGALTCPQVPSRAAVLLTCAA